MTNELLNEREMDTCLTFYATNHSLGHYKYMYEIAVPEEDYPSFISWLKTCEDTGMEFVFLVLDRYTGYKLLYGYTNFEISEREKIKLFDFSLQSLDTVYKYFMQWYEEAVSVIMTTSHNIFIKVVTKNRKI